MVFTDMSQENTKSAGSFTLPTQAERMLLFSGRCILAGDILALFLAFIASGVFSWFVDTQFLRLDFPPVFGSATVQEFFLFLILGIGALLWLDQQEHYRQRLPYWEFTTHIMNVSLMGLVISGFLQFAIKEEFSRLWLIAGWLFFGGFLFAGRNLVRRLLNMAGKWQIPVLLVGEGATAANALQALKQEYKMGYRVVEHYLAEFLQYLREPEDWHQIMKHNNASFVLFALEGSALESSQDAIRVVVRAGLPYAIIPLWLGLPTSSLRPHYFFTHDVALLYNTNRIRLRLPRILKRSFDIIVSSLAILALSPVFLIITLMVLRDGWPPFIKHERIGLHGRPFGCYKFRSMVLNNETILQRHLAENPEAAAEWQQYTKLKNDPRITRFGHFIRKTSIDELPQLLNVFKGDMSLVGPRPIIESQKHFYGDDFTFYTQLRPGITGPWQVSGRNTLSNARRVALEYWYARNWSLWIDIIIILKTIPTVLRRDQTS